MTEGKSVKLFLVDGKPGGLLTAEIINYASRDDEEVQGGLAA